MWKNRIGSLTFAWFQSRTRCRRARRSDSRGPSPAEPAGFSVRGAEGGRRLPRLVLSTWGTGHRSGRTPRPCSHPAAIGTESRPPRCSGITLRAWSAGSPRSPCSLETGGDTLEWRGKAGLCHPAAERRRKRGPGAAVKEEILGEDRRAEAAGETRAEGLARRCRFRHLRQTLGEFSGSMHSKYVWLCVRHLTMFVKV